MEIENKDKESDYLEDLSHIKEMMQRSSKFISLSGLSGVMAGVYALITAYIAYNYFYIKVNSFDAIKYLPKKNLTSLLILAIVTLVLAIGTGIFLSVRKARKKKQKIWDYQAKRLVINFFIPLVTGGILILILFSRGYLGFIAPLTLIFYGLALVNASKYTFGIIRPLGICEIILGLTASVYVGSGLLFWVLGFGVLHIIYGVYMYIKYDL